MILLTVQYPDGTNISIPRGAGGITVTDGSNVISGGKLEAITDIENPKFVPPDEPVNVTIGPPPPPQP